MRHVIVGSGPAGVIAAETVRKTDPAAEITLVSLPWAQELAARLPHVDRFVAFPGFPGLPERAPDLAALPGFLQAMQQQQYDLALQMHGS